MSGLLGSLNQFSAAALALVVNSLWQAAAVAAAAWLAMKFTPRMNAATRHLIWWAVLAAIVMLPVAPLLVQTSHAPVAPAVDEVPLVPVSTAAAMPEAPVAATPQIPRAPMEVSAGAWPLWILAAWAAVLLLQFARIAWSYFYLRGVRRRAHPASRELRANFDAWMMSCRVHRPARLLISSEIRSPMAVGFREPAVMLPERLLGQFQETELDHVLLHELAHIARRDDWTNLAARLAGGFAALHPAALWALVRIAHEREIACDDWVVSMTGAARPYAASLARLFEVCMARRRMLLASGMAESASHLGKRIEMLLRRSREFAPRASITRVALSAALLAVLAAAAANVPGWFAFAQDPAAPAAPAAVQGGVPQAPAEPLPSDPPQPPAAAVPRTPQSAPSAPAIAPAAPAPGAAIAVPRPAAAAVLADYDSRIADLRRQIADLSVAYTPAHPRMQQLRAEIAALEASLQQAGTRAAAAPDRGSFLAALVAAGYGNLSVDEIIELKNAGVSVEFLRSIGDAGWGKLSPSELIALTHRGVTPDYLKRMKAAGFKDLTLKDVTELSMHGVRPEDIEQIHALGFGPYSPQQIIGFVQVGVRPELFRGLKEAGFGSAAPNEIIEAAHAGVGPRDLREAKQYGSSLTLKQIVKLKMAGVI